MFEKQLTRPGRLVWLVAAIAGLAFTVLFGTMTVWPYEKMPWQARAGFAAGALFGIAWAILAIRIIRRGSIHLKLDTGMAAGLSWAFPVFLVTMFMVWAPNDLIGLRMILSALVFLLMGAMFMIRNWIEQSDLQSREKLLEIEYRLAELTEAVKADRPPAPSQG